MIVGGRECDEYAKLTHILKKIIFLPKIVVEKHKKYLINGIKDDVV